MSPSDQLSTLPSMPGATATPTKVTRTQAERTKAAELLAGRTLVLASSDAPQLAPLLDTQLSGMILTGSSAYESLKPLQRQNPDLLAAIEPTSVTKYTATADSPFELQTDGLFDQTLIEVLNSQSLAGAQITVTPTGFIPAGDADPIKEAVKQANDSGRNDTVLLLPVHPRWLKAENVDQLIAIAKRSLHPVGLVVCDSYKDPMNEKGVPAGYRKFFASVPAAIAWRTDMAGFEAMTHGAIAAAIGELPSMRRGIEPDRGSRSSDKTDKSPSVLLPGLLRYARTSWMTKSWFASTAAPACTCKFCLGRTWDSFTGAAEDRLAAHLHNLEIVMTLAHDMNALTSESRPAWWRRLLTQAEAEHELLSARTSVKIELPGPIKQWLSLG
ncbi:hypothetical protein ACRB8A_03840 [Arthrobacter sp. G.S.26]|uniref:hypothetical protein n=1 Tax=Arthrobacter sp. G.S.26 TaxID=3433706 RepID=UPI003D776457